ncbi:MAG: glycosyltransferase [Alphaproteobacteria bacterium]|nr:glycosyltransferase [Alphaproteobacteria bacterium]
MNNPKRRVAVVAAAFPPAVGGGVAAAHHQLAGLLQKAGAEVRRFSFLDSLPSEQGTIRRDSPLVWKRISRRVCALAFRLLDPSGRAYQTADILECWPGAYKLKSEISAFAPDEIILPDHGCPGLALGKWPKSARVTLVSHHNPMRFVNQAGLNAHSRLDARSAVLLESLSLRHVDRVVAPCLYMADCFKSTYRFSGPVDVIPNLIDFESLDDVISHDPRPEMGLAPDAKLVYVPSAGSVFKGSKILPELLARLCKLVSEPFGVFLSGSMTVEQLGKLPVGLPVHAPGYLSVCDNLARVKSCNLALSPTLIENFSMALLEAQLLGLPVASFDVGGNAELIEEGVTGRLAKPGDVEALARLASTLLPEALGDRLSNIRYRSRLRFDPDRWLSAWAGQDAQST